MRQHELRYTPTWERLSPSQRRSIERRAIDIDQIEALRLKVVAQRAQLIRNRLVADEKKAAPKNPKLRGLIHGMDMFHHAVDKDVEEATQHLDKANARRKEVFSTVHTKIDDKVGDLNSTLESFDDLEAAALGDNGPPLDDSDNKS